VQEALPAVGKFKEGTRANDRVDPEFEALADSQRFIGWPRCIVSVPASGRPGFCGLAT
jgi:hypothetical protein